MAKKFGSPFSRGSRKDPNGIEARFRDIAEHALEWIWEVDNEGKYTYSSPVVKDILGYSVAEVLKKHFYDFFREDEREKMKERALKVFSQKKPFWKFVNRNVHKDGRIIWLSTCGVPLLDKKGNVL